MNIASVSYLNAKPLIYGLENSNDMRLHLDVPAKLIDGLRERRFDVALLPIIDVQRLDEVRIVTSGGIGCDGPTLTVRIFSRIPFDQVEMLACDTHSHSSVALARILMAETYGKRPEFVQFDHAHPTRVSQAVLLIGDKVVCNEPQGFAYQIDLGEAWKKLTGLPFVFAAWIANGGVALGDLPHRLLTAKQNGMAHLDEIVQREAVPRGWPADLALRYMTEFLKYDIGVAQIQAIELFHQLALKHGMLDAPLKKLNVIY